MGCCGAGDNAWQTGWKGKESYEWQTPVCKQGLQGSFWQTAAIFISNPFFQSTHQLLGKAKRWRSVTPLDTLNQTAINEIWQVIFTHDAHSQVNVTLTPVLHPPSIYSCLSSWPFHHITSWTNTCQFLTASNWCFSPSTTKKT